MRVKSKRKFRLVWRMLFLLYILLLIYFLFFAEWYGRSAQVHTEPQYNLVPFLEIRRFWMYKEQIGIWNVFLNLAGNVIGFIPFGFILPVLSKELRKGGSVVFYGMAMSVIVEAMQLFGRVGSCDIDDVLLNTLGAFIGYLLFHVCNFIKILIGR